MPYKILIIDDEHLIRWALEQHLVKLGYQVVSAASAERGLELIAEEAPDLVLLDNCLPEMTGMQLLEKLHAREKGLKVIMISAYDMAEAGFTEMKLDVYECIDKPFNLEELTSVVKKALDSEPSGPGSNT